MKFNKLSLSGALLALTAFCGGAQAQVPQGNMNWDAIEKGAFEVTFQACTANGHPALVRLQMTTYSPMDLPMDGFLPATKEEVRQAAQKVFSVRYAPFISMSLDETVSGDTYLSDLAAERLQMEDGEGNSFEVALILVAMHDVKAELMKARRYSGMGVGYERSHVFVNSKAKCR